MLVEQLLVFQLSVLTTNSSSTLAQSGTKVRFGAQGCLELGQQLHLLPNLYDGDVEYSSGAQAEQNGLVTALSVDSGSKLTEVTKIEIYSQITGGSQFFDVIGYSDDGTTEVFNQKLTILIMVQALSGLLLMDFQT